MGFFQAISKSGRGTSIGVMITQAKEGKLTVMFYPTTQKDDDVFIPISITDLPEVFQQKEKEDEPSCSLAVALNRQSLFINGFLAINGAAWLYEMITKGFTTRSELYFNMAGPELSVKYIPEKKVKKSSHKIKK